MKYILIIIASIILISCDDPYVYKSKQKKSYEDKIITELKTGVKNDTIFLGLMFGMSKSEVRKKLYKLTNSKSVYKRKGNYYHQFALEISDVFGKAEAKIIPRFHAGRLYQLDLYVKDFSGSYTDTKFLLLSALFLLYADKYSYKDWSGFDPPIGGEGKTQKRIDGNREIILSPSFNGVLISYTDIPIKMEIDSLENAKHLKEQELTKDAI